MWRIWFFFGILEISFGAPVDTPQDNVLPSTELAVLRCLLATTPLNNCDEIKRSGVKLPKRIQKLYESIKKPFLDVKTNEISDPSSLDKIPASLLYLIPKVRLRSMSGQTASNIIKKFPFDDALTIKIVGVLGDDRDKIHDFLNGLSNADSPMVVTDFDGDDIVEDFSEDQSFYDLTKVSPGVEEEIAHAMYLWYPDGSKWEFQQFQDAMLAGTPLLASLPNYFISNLNVKSVEKFLFHIRNWRWDEDSPHNFGDSSASILWSDHKQSVKRVWAHILLSKSQAPEVWSPKTLRQSGFLLIGATPDELKRLPTNLRISHDSNILFNNYWDYLQTRAVFDLLYSDVNELEEKELRNVRNLAVNLLPRQIRQFSLNVTDFSYIARSDNGRISLPAEKQLFESHLANAFIRRHVPDVSPSSWGDHIAYLGKFVHLLPSSSLEIFKRQRLSLPTLMKIDSMALNHRQALHLTHSGDILHIYEPNTVLALKGLLKAIPAQKLAEAKSNLVAQNVKEHLLSNVPSDSLALMAAMLEKVKSDLGESSFLEKLLYNKDCNDYFSLLGHYNLIHVHKDISTNLINLVSNDPILEKKVRSLPPSVLSALLSVRRNELSREKSFWSYENLVESPWKIYISGLTCADVDMMETSDVMPIIGYYTRQMKALGLPFPKNMQYCSQKAVTDYLKLKAGLRGIKHDSIALFNLLESYEIKAVGGYILAGLPTDLIFTLSRRNQIIEEIGKLTISEMLTATPIGNLKNFTEKMAGNSQQFDLKFLSSLGNLVWFLRPSDIQKIKPEDFNLAIESQEEDASRALCFDSDERNAWKNFFVKTFGKPDSWSSTVVKNLGDLLVVFEDFELERINKATWVESADVLAETTSFFKKMEWPGKTKQIYFYETCLEVLPEQEKTNFENSVKKLLRFYLEASQYLLETVEPAYNLLKLNERPNLVDSIPSAGPLPFIPSMLINENAEPTTLPPPLTSTTVKTTSTVPKTDEDDYDDSEEEKSTTEQDPSTNNIETDLPHEKEQTKSTTTTTTTTTTTELPKRFDDEMIFALDDEEIDIGSMESFFKKKDKDGHDGKSSTPEMSVSNELQETEKETENKTENVGTTVSVSDKTENVMDPSIKRKRSIDNENGQFHEKNVNIYRSQESKTLEEMKEELRKNASRALVVEKYEDNKQEISTGVFTKQNQKLTCDAIKMLGKSASLILDDDDINKINDTELEDCTEVLGNLNLKENVKKSVWKRLRKWKETGSLMGLGNLVTALDEDEDLHHISLQLSKPWAHENLEILSSHIRSPDLMSLITDRFIIEENPSPLTYESAVSLGPLVCTLTLSHQKKLLTNQPEVFMDVANVLGRTLDCKDKTFETCIANMAKVAASEDAFGSARNWDASHLSTLGVIASGLSESDWQEINKEALAGLNPDAVSCIQPNVFKVLSEEQLSHLSALSVAAISQEQASTLSPSQYDILDRVRRQIPDVDFLVSSAISVPIVKISLLVSIFVSLFSNCIISRTFLCF